MNDAIDQLLNNAHLMGELMHMQQEYNKLMHDRVTAVEGAQSDRRAQLYHLSYRLRTGRDPVIFTPQQRRDLHAALTSMQSD